MSDRRPTERETMSNRKALTDAEIDAMALRVEALRVMYPAEWMEWEDYPELGQLEFDRLVEAVGERAEMARKRSRDHDRASDIDSVNLLQGGA